MTRTIVRHLRRAAVSAAILLPLVPWTGLHAAPALQVQDLRVGEHPGSTRVVLDISQPGEMTFVVAEDGRSISIDLPDAEWKAGAFARRHAKGVLRDYRFTQTPGGGRLTLATREPVRINAPFFVSPEGKQGHRVVIDIIADATAASSAIPSRSPAPHSTAPLPINQPLAQTFVGGPAQEPPTDVAMAPRALTASAAPSAQSIGQAVVLSPGSAARSTETAQALPPRPQQQPVPQQPMQKPMADTAGPFGGLFYVKAGAGVSVIREAESSGSGNNAAVETDLGWILLGGAGIDLRNNFRIDAEIFHTSNGAQSISGTMNGASVSSGNVSGDVSTTAFMANVNYDLANAYAVTPYIFGGAGFAMVSVDGLAPVGNVGWDDSDWVFALQGGAGLAFDVDERLTLDLSYRYFETQQPQFASSSGTPFDYENAIHLIMAGVRYKF